MRQGFLRVLVVDDDHDVVDGLVMLPRLWGYDGLAAYDGPSALEVTSATTKVRTEEREYRSAQGISA